MIQFSLVAPLPGRLMWTFIIPSCFNKKPITPNFFPHVSGGIINPSPRYFWIVSRYTSHLYCSTFAHVCPPPFSWAICANHSRHFAWTANTFVRVLSRNLIYDLAQFTRIRLGPIKIGIPLGISSDSREWQLFAFAKRSSTKLLLSESSIYTTL